MLTNFIIRVLFFIILVLIKIGQCYLYIYLNDLKVVREIMRNCR